MAAETIEDHRQQKFVLRTLEVTGTEKIFQEFAADLRRNVTHFKRTTWDVLSQKQR